MWNQKKIRTKMENRTKVYTTTVEHSAILMRDKLEAEGISALILNQRDSTYGTFGTIEVYVLNEDEEQAKILIEANS